MQSRRMSMIETIVGTLVGLVVALISQIIIFKAYGLEVTLNHNIQMTMWFTLVSIARSYTLRRVFNKFSKRTKT